MEFIQYQHEFMESSGYKEDLILYVFDSIAFALGMNLGNSKAHDNNESSIKVQQSICLPHGVTVGDWCSAILPSHEIVDAYLKKVIGNEACVRIRPWTLMRLPLSSLMQRLKKVACDE